MAESATDWCQRVMDHAAGVIRAEAQAVRNVAGHLSVDFPLAVRAVLEADGKVLTMGMGKAGHVARRLAAVLCAGGTPAVFLHPGEAAHGDLGVVSPGDTAVVCSTSGKTREVVEALVRGREVGLGTVVAITAHPGAQVGRLASFQLYMGATEEAGPLGMVPSTSTAAMSAMADALALAVMEERGTTLEEFGARHHGGYLGERARGELP